MEQFVKYFLEFFYVVIGMLLALTAYKTFTSKNHPARFGTSLFWLDLGILFACGKIFPDWLNGLLVVLLGILTGLKQVKIGELMAVDEEKSQASSEKIGSKIFIPCISLAVIAVLITQFTPLGGQVGIGLGAVGSLIIVILLTKADAKTIVGDSDRMMQQVGPTGILPQLLAALGIIFSQAGVGDVIATGISTVIPEGNKLAGAIAYVMGMVIFTMVMGNAFAAFTVITAGIGIPFVILQGGDPIVASTLAMTAGFCGTLLTPMAANFNTLPVAILEMKDNNGVIKVQAPMAFAMMIFHIVLMYFWAF
ncbi:DUF979 domain-containing protein [Vagococcus sp. PNs007]|uniref:DUF979 domain-containing protein n=1 Tax=Vagococcus proximus TaxID=2991417 RepID=A0ABT5X322_9ENTE|nr:DUF979 domain-containing protein [Vagococcus proximus]MDF0480408.1 DUF979 domain-containing protein [Vagococcus proximus]